MQQTHTVAGEQVTINAPAIGEFDPSAFESFIAPLHTVGYDNESTAFTDLEFWDPGYRVRTVQFGSDTEAWVLRLDDPAQRSAAHRVLADPDQRFVVFTETEALATLREFGIWIPPRSIDVYLLSRLQNQRTRAGGVEHDLKSLSARLIDGQLKAEKGEIGQLFRTMWVGAGGKANAKEEDVSSYGWTNVDLQHPTFVKYAGFDPIYTFRILDTLLESEDRLTPYLVDMEQWLAEQSISMRAKGVRVDVEYTQALHDSTKAVRDRLAAEFEELTGVKANSPKRVGWFEAEGVEFTVMTDNGNGSLDKKKGLPDLLLRYGNNEAGEQVTAALRLLEAYSESGNMVSNMSIFLKKRDATDHVHPRIQQMEAHTGRMSITGTALQTLPKRDPAQRNCFISDPGMVFIGADFEQVEIRLAAALAGEDRILDAIRAGEDLHDTTAELMYGSGFTKEHRTIAKTINFSILYGAGADRVRIQTGITLEKAQEAIQRWREGFPKLNAFLREMRNVTGDVINPALRFIPVDPDRTYANPNFMVQSLGRDCLVHAMYRFAEVKGWRDSFVIPIHDELLVQVPLEHAEQAKADLTWAMTFEFMDVPIAASAEIVGPRWFPLEHAETWEQKYVKQGLALPSSTVAEPIQVR